MKGFSSIILATSIVLLCIYQASHWLFKYADSVRFSAQDYLVSVDDESHAIFHEVLGKHYVAVGTSKLSYGLSPFYYTFFQAIPSWVAISKSGNYRACAKGSDYCIRNVSFRQVDYSAETYMYVLDKVNKNKDTNYRMYCIGGISGAGEHAAHQSDSASSDLLSINFSTKQAWYIIHGVTEAQLAQWEGDCE
ncbi:MAG: hypothetical protein JJU03_08250 [Idiomarina sp.]|nr:hypothetical protein [Idiomarina sp.]